MATAAKHQNDHTAKTTHDHKVIQKWAEERGGKPAHAKGTGKSEDDPGIIRIEFPSAKNANDGNLEEIGWDVFFEKFDEQKLALVYQEHTADGARSNFNKLVAR